MGRHERLHRITSIIEDNYLDVDDLVGLMELTVEDILAHCKTLLLGNEQKFLLQYGDNGEEE